ncbi:MULTISPECIES: nucleoside hydrolase [unclassified Luteococcus]|uniref:nucleoside hydrolase n=1 Tax=unclassified Luteococcus TaxID=2639923 RepID=UPI00313CE5EF
MKIIADVDTGIDDACALLYLAGCEDVELLAVTTSSGNTTAQQSALNSLAVLDVAGLPEVEVAVGSPSPLVRPLVTTPETHGPGGIGYAHLTDHSDRLSHRPWLTLWRDHLLAHPGEVTLLVTGPMTNLAIALAAFPELPELARRIVIMGGCFWHLGNTTPTAEWNTWCDPDAAKRVLAAFEGRPDEQLPILCATEMTERVEYTPGLLDALLARCGARPVHYDLDRLRVSEPEAKTGHPALDLLADALRFYFEFHHDYEQGYVAHLHDLFAAQVAAGHAEARLLPSVVDVEADSELLRGTTVRDDRGIWGRQPTARVVVDNDPDAVFAEFARSLQRLTDPARGAGRFTQ